MPYINQLQDAVAKRDAEIARLNAGLTELLIYIQSDKFMSDPTVQTADIYHRIMRIRSERLDY